MEIEAKGPAPAQPPVKQKQEKREAGQNNGRIRCPHCSWQPRKTDLWMCHCGCQWHTFDTGGKCPNCAWHWTQTQCQRCAQWAAHAAWYDDGGNPLN